MRRAQAPSQRMRGLDRSREVKLKHCNEPSKHASGKRRRIDPPLPTTQTLTVELPDSLQLRKGSIDKSGLVPDSPLQCTKSRADLCDKPESSRKLSPEIPAPFNSTTPIEPIDRRLSESHHDLMSPAPSSELQIWDLHPSFSLSSEQETEASAISTIDDEVEESTSNKFYTLCDGDETPSEELFLGPAVKTELNGPCDERREAPPPLGLFPGVFDVYLKVRRIEKLYAWQRDACTAFITAPQKPRRVVYSVPTSGGKTLVAELIALRILLSHKRPRDVVFMVPYIGIVEEQAEELQAVGNKLGFLVELYAGAKGRIPPIRRRGEKQRTCFVCTFEKACALIDSLSSLGKLEETIGLVVVDELHMLGDSNRGPLLEQLLARLVPLPELEMVGISATISNLDALANFLGSAVYQNNFRPVSLERSVLVTDSLYKIKEDGTLSQDPSRKLKLKPPPERRSAYFGGPDSWGDAAIELGEMLSDSPRATLVFCASKKVCEMTAVRICNQIHASQNVAQPTTHEVQRQQLLEELAHSVGGVSPILRFVIPYGVVYHHAGLTMVERHTIERAFKNKTLKCICATTTLAAGVNLPAELVLIPRLDFTWKISNPLRLRAASYYQMCGRAGRAGLATTGSAVLMLQSEKELATVQATLLAGVEPLQSKLCESGGKHVRAAIISLLLCANDDTASKGIPIQKATLDSWARKTLCYQQRPREMSECVNREIEKLMQMGLLCKTGNQQSGTCYTLTMDGYASAKALVHPDEVCELKRVLQTAIQPILSTDLHLIFLTIPFERASESQIFPYKKGKGLMHAESIERGKELLLQRYARLWRSTLLSMADKEVCEHLKCGTQYIEMSEQHSYGQYVRNGNVTARRLYLALCIQRVIGCDFISLQHVSTMFELPVGDIQDLIKECTARANKLATFCGALDAGWGPWLSTLFKTLSERLRYGVPKELVPLMEIKGMQPVIAHALMGAGLGTIDGLVEVTAKHVVAVTSGHLHKMGRGPVSKELAQEIISAAQERQRLTMLLAENTSVIDI